MRLVTRGSPYSLEDRTSPTNQGITEWAKGPENKRMVRTAALGLQRNWMSLVSKRTGQLAAGSRVSTDLFVGKNLTSWTGTVEVSAHRTGANGERFNYALAHEFGYIKNGKRVEGHHELLKVLRMGGVIG